ncbi:hypothetical protein D6D02_07263 [Aureobasidium pullulans]|nr:hypothetical protein D6D02_07263 [Aureobasidium pullulans]
MAHPDVSMGGTNAGSSTFSIPHAPKFPDGNLRDTARDFGARENPDGNSFEVRPIDPDDLTGEGRLSPDDFPIQYRLGPPCKSMGWSEVVHKWGLQMLERAGFLNVDVLLADDWYMSPFGKFAAKDLWHKTTDTDYDLMRPALILASAFLDDPTTLCLFHAMAVPADQMTTFLDPKLGWCKRLDVPATLSDDQQIVTYHKICMMRQYMSIYWETFDNQGKYGAVAYTKPQLGRPVATGPNTNKSSICMSRVYLEVMERYKNRSTDSTFEAYFDGILDNAGVPENRRPRKIDLDSAALRATLMFASYLLHEFAHAFCKAYVERPPERPPTTWAREPWLADNRSNELGLAFTDAIFGGVPTSTVFRHKDSNTPEEGYAQCYYAPFGLHFPRKWKQWSTKTKPDEGLLEQGKQDDLTAPMTFYPIAQQQVVDMFDEEKWNNDVLRNGIGALRFKAHREWAVHRTPGPDPDNPLKSSGFI